MIVKLSYILYMLRYSAQEVTPKVLKLSLSATYKRSTSDAKYCKDQKLTPKMLKLPFLAACTKLCIKYEGLYIATATFTVLIQHKSRLSDPYPTQPRPDVMTIQQRNKIYISFVVYSILN
jgi:hypothetical protein